MPEEKTVKAPYISGDRMALLIFVILATSTYIFSYVAGDMNRGCAAVISEAAIVFGARLTWDQHKRWWFWVTLAILGAIYASIVISFPMNYENPPWAHNQLHFIALLPAVVAYLAVTFGIIRLVQWVAGIFSNQPGH